MPEGKWELVATLFDDDVIYVQVTHNPWKDQEGITIGKRKEPGLRYGAKQFWMNKQQVEEVYEALGAFLSEGEKVE